MISLKNLLCSTSLGLAVVAGLALSSQAKANHSCTAVLENEYGQVLQEFSVSDDDASNACQVALQDCYREAREQHDNYPYAQCRLQNGGYNPYPGPNPNPYPNPYPGPNPYPNPNPGDRYTNRCVATLYRHNGEVIRQFYGTGFSYQEACQNAQWQCQNEVNRGGHHRGGYCAVGNGPGPFPGPHPGPGPGPFPGPHPGPGPGGFETRRCDVGLFRYNQLVRTFSGQASGPYGSQVAERACQQATVQCQQASYGYGQDCRRLRVY